ncbi:tetratricopeptide repeat protein [Streptosporangium sp. NPDC049046]|uniref:tetratricopeptide repeat protein n=1 Tax=Streptosporangium sp. NPDC049046 TaxID=3155031 RepID=UPI003440EC41
MESRGPASSDGEEPVFAMWSSMGAGIVVGAHAHIDNAVSIGHAQSVNVHLSENEPPFSAPPLPKRPALCIGRENELEELTAGIASLSPPTGMVTTVAIVGSPGVGKTTLALTFTHSIAKKYPDGQIYLQLENTERSGESEDLLELILLSLGQRGSQIPKSVTGRIGLVRSILSKRQILILVDNVTREAQLRGMLPIPDGSLLVCTSRSGLSGLRTPGVHHQHIGTLSQSAATAYLSARVGESRVLPPDQMDRLAELCGRLPLALHLISAKLLARPNLTVAKMICALTDKKQRLKGLRVGELSIRAAFEMSYTDLAVDSACAFRALGSHPTGNISASIAVAATDALISATATFTDLDAEELLDELVEQGLVEHVGVERFRIHDLVLSYASALFLEDEATEAQHKVTIAVCQAYVALAMELAGQINPQKSNEQDGSPIAVEIMEIITNEDLANCLEVAQQAVDICEWNLAAELAFSADPILRARSRWRALLRMNELVLAAAAETLNSWWQARALLSIGHARVRLGEVSAGQSAIHDSFELSRESGYTNLAIEALHHVAQLQAESQPDEAAKLYKLILKSLRQTGNREGIASALSGLADCMLRTGRPERAEQLLQHALAIVKDATNLAFRAAILANLGLVCLELERPHEAHAFIDMALRDHIAATDPSGEAGAHLLKGRIAEALSDTGSALCEYQRALELYEKLEEVAGQQTSFSHIGGLFHATGRPAEAAEYYQKSLDLAETLFDSQAIVVSLANLGTLWLNVGELESAKEALTRALRVAEDSENSFLVTQALQQFSKYWTHQGEWERAAQTLERVLTLVRNMRANPNTAETRVSLSYAYFRLGRQKDALRELRLAESELGAGSTSISIVAVKRQLATILSSRGMFDEAIAEAEDALERSKTIGLNPGIAESLGVLANVLARQGEFARAAGIYRECIQLASDTLDLRLLVSHTVNLSTCLANSSQAEDAFEGYKNALKLAGRLQDRSLQATILRCIGVEHAKSGRSAEALKRFAESERIATSLGDKHLIAVLRTDQAQVYVGRQKLDRARQLLENAQHIYAELNDVDAERKTLLRILGVEVQRDRLSGKQLPQKVNELLCQNGHSPAGAFLRRDLIAPTEAYQFLGSEHQLPGRRINISSDVRESLPPVDIEGALQHMSVSRQNCIVCRQPLALGGEANLIRLLHRGEDSLLWLKLSHSRCGPSEIVTIDEIPQAGIVNMEIECALMSLGDTLIPSLIIDIPYLARSADGDGSSDTFLDGLVERGFTRMSLDSHSKQIQAELVAAVQNPEILAVLHNGRVDVSARDLKVLSNAPLSFLPAWYERTYEGILGVMVGHNLQGMSWESTDHIIDAAMRGRLVFGIAPLVVHHPPKGRPCICTPSTGRKFKRCCGSSV